MQNNGKGLSVAGLVLGICAAVFAWWGTIAYAALACGIVGIICSVKGKKAAKAAGAPTGLATAGIVLAIIGTVLAGIGVVACTLCAAAANSVEDAYADALDEAMKYY